MTPFDDPALDRRIRRAYLKRIRMMGDLKPKVDAICDAQMDKGRSFFVVSRTGGLARDPALANLTASRESIAALIGEWQLSKTEALKIAGKSKGRSARAAPLV